VISDLVYPTDSYVQLIARLGTREIVGARSPFVIFQGEPDAPTITPTESAVATNTSVPTTAPTDVPMATDTPTVTDTPVPTTAP
ncbi:MAG TPA: hypothetical protein VFI12_04510, partial [Thermomicrobiales bacterium]|nr:hypothetical protein [Thermomicrobiales bacterium]